MSKQACRKGIARIIDANINRLKEGLRVCEEVARFSWNDRGITARLKRVRHDAEAAIRLLPERRILFAARDSAGDSGRHLTTERELARAGVCDVFFVNMQRVKESLRVLEEFSKLIDPAPARACKELRYSVYTVEKAAMKRMPRAR